MLHPIQGYLPVRVGSEILAQTSRKAVPTGSVPVFSFEIAGGENVATNPDTGVTRPATPRTIRYELIDTQVKRIGPDLAPIPITHTAAADKKAKDQKAAKKKRK